MRNYRMFVRLFVCAVTLLALMGLSPTRVAAESSAPTCLGKEVTVFLANGDRSTNGDDVILGTGGPDVIKGRGGNDLICGLGGNDRILGGSGNDRIKGGSGDDLLSGGPGIDRLFGGAGDDPLAAGRRNGLLNGGPGIDDCAGSTRRTNCEPNCLTRTSLSFRILRENFRIANEAGTSCHFGPDGLQLLALVEQPPNIRKTGLIPHLDSDEIDAESIPAPTSIGPGQTLIVTFVNQALPCAEDTPRTSWVDIRSGVRNPQVAFELSTCGLGYTTRIKN